MANQVIPNLVRDLTNAADAFHGVFKLAQAMIHAGWRPVAHSNGTTKVSAGSYTNTNWFALQNVGAGGTGPSVTLKEHSGLMTITGVSGLVSPTSSDPGSEGRFLTFTGFASAGNNGTFQIAEVVSATSCKVWNNSGVAGDANNGTGGVTWQEKSFLTAPYSPATFATQAPWCVLEGGRIVKVPINAAPGALLVGETVTQGAGDTQRIGEFLGYVYDSVSGTGWLVIDPRDYGTWDTTTITGVLSTATMPGANITGTPQIFVHEVVFWKTSASYHTGSVYWGCFNAATESALRFSTLAGNSDCTAAVAPGGGATGGNNPFPGFAGTPPFPARTLRGTAAATSPAQAQSHTALMHATANSGLGSRFQILVANAIPRPDRSADNTWVLEHSFDASGAGYLLGVFRLDETEPGEVCPYAGFSNLNLGVSSQYTALASPTTSVTPSYGFYTGTSTYSWHGFTARGCGVAANDLPTPLIAMEPCFAGANALTTGTGTNYARQLQFPTASGPFRRVQVELGYSGAQTLAGPGTTFPRSFKGKVRWMHLMTPGNLLDDSDTKGYIAVFAQNGATSPAVYVGPYDRTTTPLA